MSSISKPDADPALADHPGHEPSTQVYAVHGADPEVQAYGMAKYSRSALSMRESLAEISEQKAEKFLNTFYFQYGHRSIADLAHIAFAIERLSILAATVVVDEPRWDGQERSTRYQDFQKSGYYVPDFGDDTAARTLYRETVDLLVRRIPSFFRRDVRLPARPHAQAARDEAGDIRAHFARPRLRSVALPAAAGDQHLARPDRQRAHSGDAGLAIAFAHPRRGPAAGRTAEAGRT